MDLEALTSTIWLLLGQWKELQFIIWTPQNCLEFEGNLNARWASAISSARIPSESYADFFLWTLVVTLRVIFFLYFSKTFEHLIKNVDQRLAMLALRKGWVGQIAHCLGRFPDLCSFHFVSQLMLRRGSTTKLTMLSPCHLRLPTLVYCGLSWEKTSPWQL